MMANIKHKNCRNSGSRAFARVTICSKTIVFERLVGRLLSMFVEKHMIFNKNSICLMVFQWMPFAKPLFAKIIRFVVFWANPPVVNFWPAHSQ